MTSINLKLKGMMLFVIIIIVSFGYALTVQTTIVTGDPNSYTNELVRFSSYEQFSDFLNNCSYDDNYNYGSGFRSTNIVLAESADIDGIAFASKGGHTVEYSETNIQVEGVDEPDVVKTDGTYIYLVSGGDIYIIKAYPAENATVVSKISVNYSLSNIFINGDRLVVFGNSYDYFICKNGLGEVALPWYSSSNTYIKVYDVSDRSKPELKRDIVVGGNYFNARMMGDYVYLITTQNSYDTRPCYEGNDTIVPLIAVDDVVRKIPLSDIYCIDIPSRSYTFTHVVSIDIKDDSKDVVDKIFTLGNSQTMYVSKTNIYITYQVNRYDYKIMQQIIDEVVMPILPDEIKEDVESARNFDIADCNKRQVVEWILENYYQTLDEDERTEIQTEIQRRIQRTVIHKISVDDGGIEYKCNGTIPGRILNQFSMDEHSKFFRVATQTDGYWQSNVKKCTNIYVLDENLEIVGEIENIAPGENMHSARFMGNRAYLVTFKNIDPFFVIDLSDPHSPEILGELKIPGYSDYLHPYDETHVIGIGKDSDETIDADKIHSENAVYYTAILGVKIALFDVSDPENPKEVSKVVIGDRGTSTPVLNDHKAFLFDREKELLVLPINLHEFKDDDKNYADFTFQGAYVYKLNLEDGFEYQGRITHQNDDTFEDGYRWYKWPSQVTRSLYIDNVLYTISDSMVKMNSLDDLSEINSVKLN